MFESFLHNTYVYNLAVSLLHENHWSNERGRWPLGVMLWWCHIISVSVGVLCADLAWIGLIGFGYKHKIPIKKMNFIININHTICIQNRSVLTELTAQFSTCSNTSKVAQFSRKTVDMATLPLASFRFSLQLVLKWIWSIYVQVALLSCQLLFVFLSGSRQHAPQLYLYSRIIHTFLLLF